MKKIKRSIGLWFYVKAGDMEKNRGFDSA